MTIVEILLILSLLSLLCCAAPRTCGSGEYRCRTGACIDNEARCDGTWDCPNGDDEVDCPKALPMHPECNRQLSFLCADESACIPIDWRCDDERDCDDNSDELHCGSSPEWAAEVLQRTTASPAANKTVTCTAEQFRCFGGSCIPFIVTCNGKRDCPAGDDETEHCDECLTGVRPKCSHFCINSPHGSKCACPHGMVLGRDHHTCFAKVDDAEHLPTEWEVEPESKNTAVFVTGAVFMIAALAVIGSVAYVRSRVRNSATSPPSASMVNAPLHNRSLSASVHYSNPFYKEGTEGNEEERCIIGNDS